MNTWINKLSKTELEAQLEAYGVDNSGNAETLRSRLRQFIAKNPELFEETTRMSKIDDAPRASYAETSEFKIPDPATAMNRMRKWGLHFDGKDPFAFLERLDELARSHRYPDEYFLLGLPELLRGDPLLWYRNNRHAWSTWDDFCQAFRAQYLPPEYQRTLRREVEGRQQRPGETFDKYATAILTMMRRAEGYSDREQLAQLYENMSPEYQLYIKPNEAKTVAELSAKALQYEKVDKRRKEHQVSAKRESGPTVAAATYNRDDCCWRCKQRGHTRMDCKRPPKKFCSRCGKDGVFTRDCHPPAGNQQRVGETAAVSDPEKLE